MVDISKEGAVMNSIMYRRCLKEHKNYVQCTVGPTGSGKSLQNLRVAELWYSEVLRKPFPLENICFSPDALLERIEFYSTQAESGKDIRGEIIIFEEAGTSMGNLDFQTSIAKAVNYVLQAFRSMNLILFLNLPYFTMLNKSTRMLCTMLCETAGIDKNRKVCIIKPKFLQYSQNEGKMYQHYPQVSVNGFYEKIEYLEYSLPSDSIRVPYEEKKSQFLRGLVSGSKMNIENSDKKRLTPLQMQIFGCWKQGVTETGDIAKKINVIPNLVSKNLHYMRNKGYLVENYYGNAENSTNFSNLPPSEVNLSGSDKNLNIKSVGQDEQTTAI
jgi:hypothetical protein